MRARDNPFATARVHRIRYQFEGLTWEGFLHRLERHNYRGAIVGPEGSGKSTLMEDLRPRLIERGFDVLSLQLTQEEPRFSPAVRGHLRATLTPTTIILLDGGEQMSRGHWWQFQWLTRHAAGLIVTAHRPGRLKTIWHCHTHPSLLENIVQKLMTGQSRVSRPEVEQLFREHGGNIREALRKLYDRHASMPDALARAVDVLEKNSCFKP